MKLKKASLYLLSFLILSVMFSACYYMSYLHALNQFNKDAIERKDELYALLEKINPTQAADNPDDQTEMVNVQPEPIVLPNTKYILETYDMKAETVITEELNPPAYLVGLTRVEIAQYLSDYMSDLTLSEYNKGLISFELLKFSEEEIVIKKTYNEDFVPFRFYVVVKDGFVVVYNSDLKSVYTYTHIAAKDLPEEDRIELSQGIYVNSLEELYALLESYSS